MSAAARLGPAAIPQDPTRLPARLDSFVGALARPRDRIEAAFLDVGARLGDASTLLNRIVAAFEALPRDLDGPEMDEAMGRLAAFAGRAREIADAFATEKQDIERLLAAVNAATQPIFNLKRSVRMMGILAVNARIVAAGLADAADHFDVFTTDIADLSGTAARTVTAFSEGHEHLAKAVQGAAGQFTEFEAAHRSVLAALATNLDRGLGQVAERRQTSAGRSTETLRVSQAIATRVASAVMALQVGDSTRQRVQHGEEMLSTLAVWAKGGAAAEITVPKAQLAQLTSLTLELSRAQLRATIQSFDADIGGAERTLRALADDADAAIADCLGLYGDGGVNGSPVAALGEHMREAGQLLRACADERGRLDELASTVGGMVEVLLGHVEAVQEIEANMRLVGLNAAVKCAQLGERGASLSVIAAQLRELTRELVPASHAALARLQEATEAAQAFTTGSTSRLAGEVARLEAEGAASVELVAAVDRRLREALATLDRDGGKATGLLSDAARGLSGHGDLSEALADVETGLAELAADWPASRETDASVAEALRRLRRRYSMDAERRIHDKIAAPFGAAGGEPATPPGERAPANQAADEVLLF
ncbi:MAG: hypothetical protein P4M09_07400 [Devosia sp.]|nr:hypothetical protein [Devosia sp.]